MRSITKARTSTTSRTGANTVQNYPISPNSTILLFHKYPPQHHPSLRHEVLLLNRGLLPNQEPPLNQQLLNQWLLSQPVPKTIATSSMPSWSLAGPQGNIIRMVNLPEFGNRTPSTGLT